MTFNALELKATSVLTSYPTCPPIMTEVNIGQVQLVKFECDTAASHNIMSEETYQNLRKKGPSRIPQARQQQNLAIRLADGSTSGKSCGSIEVEVQACNSKVVKMQFFVVRGPNNLLGRHALENIWPSQFRALREVAEVPMVKTPVVNVVKVAKKQRKQQQKSQSSSVQSAVVPRQPGGGP